MGVITKKEEMHSYSGIKMLSIVGMMVALAAASINTVWALYLDNFFNNEVYVGLFSSFLTVIAFASYFFFIPLIEKKDKAKIYAASLVFFIVFYILFALKVNFAFMVVLSIAMTALISLRVTSYGILVKDSSSNRELAKNEGFVYTLLNTAFVIGPLLAGYLAARFGLKYVFVIAAFFMAIGFVTFKFSGISGSKGKKHIDRHTIRNFKDFFKDKNRTVAYFIGSGLQLWWILIYLFVPLHMKRDGLSEMAIGVFLFAVAVPLILLEFYFSKKASKVGFRKIFKTGYFIVMVLSLLAFIFSMNLYVMLSLLVLASVGMAMLEPTTQAYFFDILKGKEEYRFYGPYNTAMDTGNLVGKLAGSVILVFLPFKFIFLIYALFMFLLFLLSSKAKGVVESRRKL